MEVDHPSNPDMKESFRSEPQNFDSDIAHHAADQADLNISDERVKIEAEAKLATRLVDRFQAPTDLKQELIDFIVDFYDITEENALDTTKQASLELCTGMRSFLENQGLVFNPQGTVDPLFKTNQKALANAETSAGLEKYLQLVDLNTQIQAKKPFKPTVAVSPESTVLFEVEENGTLKKDPESSIPPYKIHRGDVFDTMLGEENGKNNPDIDIFEIKNPKDFKSILKSKNVLESLPKTEAEQEEEHGKIIYQALEKYKFSSEIEDTFVADALQKIATKQEMVTEENVADIIFSVADKLKLEITLGLLKHDFSLDHYGKLTLPENKKSILGDESIAWNLKLLEAANKIISPADNLKTLTIVPAETKPEAAHNPENITLSPDAQLAQELDQLHFSEQAINAAQDKLIVELMTGSTIVSPGAKQKGLLGFEQIVSRAISALEKQAGFTLDTNKEPVLAENFLQKSLLFWNKTSRINKAKGSLEYKRLVSLFDLQTETKQKIAEAEQNRPNRSGTKEFSISPPTTLRQKSEPTYRRGSLATTALAGAAAGVMAGTALYKNQETDALESFAENTLVVPKKEAQAKVEVPTTISPRFEETDSVQPRRPASEAPTIADLPATVARVSDSETVHPAKEVLEEVKPTVAKKSTFKKPVSLGTKKSPKHFKIDPFTYQDTDPTTAPKIDRPVEVEDYEEAPDLDVPPAYHKRLVKKFNKPTTINKDTVRNTTPGKPVPRTKESPYLATPSVPGTVRRAAEVRVNPEIRLPKNNKKVEETKQELKKTPDISTSKNNVQEDSKKSVDAEEEETIETERFYKAERVARELSSKFSQISDLGRLEDQIKSGAVVADLTLLPSYEQKLYSDIAQLRPTFEAQKNQALQIGGEILTKVMAAEKSAANKTRMQRLNSLKQILAEGIEIIKQVDRDLKKLDEQAERKLVGYPALKPIKKKTGKDYPDKNNLAKAK